MKSFSISFLLAALFIATSAKGDMSYFLPKDVEYKTDIPSPEEFFGHELGMWHLSHDQVLAYMKEIARSSKRALIQEYARSYENRPLIHIIFTSEENHRNLDELKKIHVDYSNPEKNTPSDKVPLVLTLGYGIHGNESSATNSSVLTAYYLAAAKGDKIDSLLNSTIILVDPCLNPDGFTRHSTWVNSHQSKMSVPSSESRQFAEAWPGARSNHYWFDLNRDYILLVNPETKGRVAKMHEWKPNINTDHHEMGANSTFFFQPGDPIRNNPLTPQNNYKLTKEIAKYHAKHLDNIGSYYYSEERFDDFYYGKGSSYPDINSGIGILFEQAGFRGRERETPSGTKKFEFAIKNQFTLTLSTLEAAIALKEQLIAHQRNFYKEALSMAKKDAVKGYVFGDKKNRTLTLKLVDLLNQHHINVSALKNDLLLNDNKFEKNSSFVVSLNQPQYRLIKTLFEENSKYKSTIFYDVSTWTLPYALNIPFEEISVKEESYIGDITTNPAPYKGQVLGDKKNVAYAFGWNEHHSPMALYMLQQNGIKTLVATETFSASINKSEELFDRGTILIPSYNQPISQDSLYNLVNTIAKETGIVFNSIHTGLTESGIDLGSDSFTHLKKPNILMMVGNGVSSSEAGGMWHLFDQEQQIPITLVDVNSFDKIRFNKYNVCIMPGGQYSTFGKTRIEKMKSWIKDGGVLIVSKDAAKWAAKQNLTNIKFKNTVRIDSTYSQKYADKKKNESINGISGAIFETNIDVTHPLCYGYSRSNLPIFKAGSQVGLSTKLPYSEPVTFSNDPFISGYVSEGNIARIKNSPVLSVKKLGKGKIISYYEDFNFRGIWLGTSRLITNSVFFGSIIQ